MQDLVFKPATVEDVPALNKLVNSAYRGDVSKKGWTTEAFILDGIRTDEEALREMIQKPGAVILKCNTAEGDLVGCVYLEKKGDKLYLGMLSVDPHLQASGIGKGLLAEGERYAKENNCTAVIMTVITVRHELIEWYKRKGYSITGERQPFPSDPRFGIPKQPLEFLVMEKPMTASLRG
jgi:ribosomal protein S18 acetylase RimI-like enzyme